MTEESKNVKPEDKKIAIADKKSDDRKCFIVDTSAIMHEPEIIENLGNNLVVLHICVTAELDRHKRDEGESGYSAREASRRIDKYREAGDLRAGVPTASSGLFFVDYTYDENFNNLPVGLERNNDNRMVLLAKKWQKKQELPVIFISKDTNLRITANACGIKAEDYKRGRVASFYDGTKIINVQGSETGEKIFEKFFKEQEVAADSVWDVADVSAKDLLPNQCCFIKSASGASALALYKKRAGIFHPVHLLKKEAPFKLAPRNAEQIFAYAMLVDQSISLVSLDGPAGVGKTLLPLLVGYSLLEKKYDHLLIYRPNYELGQPMGFLKGHLREKFGPWMQPIFDNFKLILGAYSNDEITKTGKKKFERQEKPSITILDILEEMMNRGVLEISPINFIQGRSLHNSFIIVDEAQNFTRSHIKMIVTRAGVGSKMVIVGDPEQIANPYLDAHSCGVAHLVDRMKGEEIYGHITLKKTQRSELAEISARRL